MSVFEIQALGTLLLYSLLILGFYLGWLLMPFFKPAHASNQPQVSLLIACRNEAPHLEQLFTSLEAQDYPDSKLELIFINDHSDDQTATLINDFCESHTHARLIELPAGKHGKKQALAVGAQSAKGVILMVTDADCRPATGWITTMCEFYWQSGSDLILGPVSIEPANSLAEKLQRLEFISLMMSSAGACGLNQAIMAHGPNMAIKTSSYLKFSKNLKTRFSSGDDVFLLQNMKQDRSQKISFVKSPKALVKTAPVPGLKSFFTQRRRWASKAKGYTDPGMLITTLLVFMASVELVAACILAITGQVALVFLFLLFAVKTVADLPILLSGLKFYNFLSGLWLVLPMQIIYPFYVTFTGLASFIGKYEWKGRNVK